MGGTRGAVSRVAAAWQCKVILSSQRCAAAVRRRPLCVTAVPRCLPCRCPQEYSRLWLPMPSNTTNGYDAHVVCTMHYGYTYFLQIMFILLCFIIVFQVGGWVASGALPGLLRCRMGVAWGPVAARRAAVASPLLLPPAGPPPCMPVLPARPIPHPPSPTLHSRIPSPAIHAGGRLNRVHRRLLGAPLDRPRAQGPPRRPAGEYCHGKSLSGRGCRLVLLQPPLTPRCPMRASGQRSEEWETDHRQPLPPCFLPAALAQRQRGGGARPAGQRQVLLLLGPHRQRGGDCHPAGVVALRGGTDARGRTAAVGCVPAW